MESLIIELRKLAQFYFDLQKELSDALNEAANDTERSLSESILQIRFHISQVERMNAHILQLSDDLKKFRNMADPEIRARVDVLTSEVKAQGILVRDLCIRSSEMIEKSKAEMRRELESIAAGKRYLKSVNPVKTNYPKFIDSTG